MRYIIIAAEEVARRRTLGEPPTLYIIDHRRDGETFTTNSRGYHNGIYRRTGQ